jgi:hypothetical protein
LVDLDADARQDILSGCWPRCLYFFRGQPDGTFAAGALVTDREGKPLEIDYGTAVYAADWDADGDFDLLVGTSSGDVYLVRNDGSAKSHAFTSPAKLTAGGQAISAPHGDAGPVAADWDGDGRLDLLVGAGDGSVLWYRNTGTPAEPVLAAGQTIIPPPEKGSQRGLRAKICVTDWNEDGWLDILLGDFGEQFVKELSAEERRWREEARGHQAELLRAWARVFRDYRQAVAALQPEPPDLRHKHQQQILALRDELQRLNRAKEKAYYSEQALSSGHQYHGRVWLFLRRPAPSTPASTP